MQIELVPESVEANMDSASAALEVPPSIKLQFSQMRLIVIRGINLPKVEGGAGIDAYLEISFSGVKLRTKTVSNLSPAWYDEILLPLIDPSFIDCIKIQLFDYNTILKNMLVGSANLKVSSIKKDKFKKQGWVHLYGANNKASSDTTKLMNEYPNKGSISLDSHILQGQRLSQRGNRTQCKRLQDRGLPVQRPGKQRECVC